MLTNEDQQQFPSSCHLQ